MVKKTDHNARIPVCIVCSSGGHLSEALVAVSKVENPYYFVTFDEPHVHTRLDGTTVYYVTDPHVSLLLYIKNMWESFRIFVRHRPRVIISTGAGIALATLVLGWIYGSTIIYIESGARVTAPSRTGRFAYKLADVFIVQWKPLLQHFPNAIYGGVLL